MFQFRIDYNNIFDNGVDDLSDLVNQFTKKNKRVHRIFGDDDDDVQVNNVSKIHKKCLKNLLLKF